MNDIQYHDRDKFTTAILSIILPGFGQLYNGRWNRALGFFLCLSASYLAAMGWSNLVVTQESAFIGFILSLTLLGLVWIAALVDAMILCTKNRSSIKRDWQTLPVYISVFLFIYITIFYSLGSYTRTHIAEPFRIPSQSMLPGLMRGDFIFASKNVNCKGCKRPLQRGDVALFLYPENRNYVFIKRIIGLPGDKIEIRSQSVFVNGKNLTTHSRDTETGTRVVTEGNQFKSYTVHWSRIRPQQSTFTVPAGQVFVMGDNRNHSQDSRTFGTVPAADVIGVAHYIWLSVDENRQLRWDRLGELIL